MSNMNIGIDFGSFTCSQLAGLCRAIATANPEKFKSTQETLSSFFQEWMNLQVTPSTAATKRELEIEEKELKVRMARFLGEIFHEPTSATST